MPNESEIYNKLGKLEAMAEQGMAEREKIFEKLDVIVDRLNQTATVTASVSTVDAKAEKAHERLDKLVEHLDSVKGKALMIIGSASVGTAGMSHMIEAWLKKFIGG